MDRDEYAVAELRRQAEEEQASQRRMRLFDQAAKDVKTALDLAADVAPDRLLAEAARMILDRVAVLSQRPENE